MKGYIAAIMAAFFFAFGGIFIKLIGTDVPITTLTFFRVFFGFLFIAAVIPFIDRNFYKITKKELLETALIGFLFSINLLFFNASFLFLPVANVYLAIILQIFLIGIIAHFALKERFTKTRLLAAAMALIGLAIMNPFQQGQLPGYLLIAASIITFSIVAILMRYMDKTHTIGIVFWYMLFASLSLSPFLLIDGIGNAVQDIALIVAFGVMTIGIAWTLTTFALERLEVELQMFLTQITMPVTAAVLALIILVEVPTITTLIGGAIILASVIFIKKQDLK